MTSGCTTSWIATRVRASRSAAAGEGGRQRAWLCGLLCSNDSSRLSAGGRTHLELSRGRDVTELFESYHALVDAPNTMMSKYLAEDQEDVPQLSFDWCGCATTRRDSPRPLLIPGARLDRSKQPIYADLKRKVRAYFGEEGIKRGDHKCTWAAWARYMFFSFMFLVSLHAWINGKWWSLIGMPWFYWVGPSGLMHSGSHSALSKMVVH